MHCPDVAPGAGHTHVERELALIWETAGGSGALWLPFSASGWAIWRLPDKRPVQMSPQHIQIAEFFGNNPQVLIPCRAGAVHGLPRGTAVASGTANLGLGGPRWWKRKGGRGQVYAGINSTRKGQETRRTWTWRTRFYLGRGAAAPSASSKSKSQATETICQLTLISKNLNVCY